jgi:hypothetical protein
MPIAQQRARANLKSLRRAFTDTGQPCYAWLAYVQCRGAHLRCPPWLWSFLLEHLDVTAAARSDPSSTLDEKGMTLAAAVWERAAAGGWSRDAAWFAVKDDKRVSYSTVRRAWLKYAHLFEPLLSISYADPESEWFQNGKRDLKTKSLARLPGP